MGARTMTLAEANEIAQKRIEQLEAENAKLKEAAQAVLVAGDDIPTTLLDLNDKLDALAALIQEGE